MEPVQAGIRFNSHLFVALYLEPEGEDMSVTVELKEDDGNITIANGSVVWEEGE